MQNSVAHNIYYVNISKRNCPLQERSTLQRVVYALVCSLLQQIKFAINIHAVISLTISQKRFLYTWERQNLPYSQVNLFFNCLQMRFRKVDRRMPLESKANQLTKLAALLYSHHFPANIFIRDAVRVRTRLGIFAQMFIVVRHGIVKQRNTIIENRRCSKHPPCSVLSKDPKVPEMPVFVID